MWDFLTQKKTEKKPKPIETILDNQTKFLELMHKDKSETPQLKASLSMANTVIQNQKEQIAQLLANKTDMENKLSQLKPTSLLNDSGVNSLFCEIFILIETVYPEMPANDLGKIQIEVFDRLSNGHRLKHDKDKLNAVIYQCILSYRAVMELFR